MTATRNMFLLYALVIAAGLITNPWFNMGFNDDWEYSLVALRFAQTGHITYGGWGAPAVLVQTVYGALLTKLFGGTFITHRLGTLFVAGFIPVLVYQTGKRLKLDGTFALFGALTVGLSPLFIPLAVSFMTDSYGCLFALAAVYAGIRSVQAERGRAATGWFALGMLVAFAGGINRQVIWVAGPAIAAAYFVARYRLGRHWLLACTPITLTYIFGCWLVMVWLKNQPGFLYDTLDWSTIAFVYTHLYATVLRYGALLMTVLVLAVPTLAVGARAGRTGAFTNAIGFCGGFFVFFASYSRNELLFPYLSNVLTRYGLFFPNLLLPGDQPAVLPVWACRLISAVAFGLALRFLASLLWALLQSGPRKLRTILPSNKAETATIVSILLPCAFILLYLVPLLECSGKAGIYDRYALPLLPFVVVMILLAWQHCGAKKPGMIAYALLIVFSVYGVAITHDHFALSAARMKAVEAFRSRGVSPDLFLAGLEYDLTWRESRQGRLTRAKTPPEQAALASLDLGYVLRAPGFEPIYFLSTSALPGFSSCGFEPVKYGTWLSPRRRELLVLCADGRKP